MCAAWYLSLKKRINLIRSDASSRALKNALRASLDNGVYSCLISTRRVGTFWRFLSKSDRLRLTRWWFQQRKRLWKWAGWTITLLNLTNQLYTKVAEMWKVMSGSGVHRYLWRRRHVDGRCFEQASVQGHQCLLRPPCPLLSLPLFTSRRAAHERLHLGGASGVWAYIYIGGYKKKRIYEIFDSIWHTYFITLQKF